MFPIIAVNISFKRRIWKRLLNADQNDVLFMCANHPLVHIFWHCHENPSPLCCPICFALRTSTVIF